MEIGAVEKIRAHSDMIRTGFVVLIVVLCLFAMFSIPSMSASGDSQLSLGEPSRLMIMLIGLAIGCYGTIIGIGGGPLIVPILVLFYGWENEFLVATSLFIVFLNALSGTIGYAAQGRIDYTGGLKFAFAAVPGVIMAGFIHHTFNIRMFDVIFAIFLILLAIYSILSTGKLDIKRKEDDSSLEKQGYRHVEFVDSFNKKFSFYSNDELGIFMNLLLGFFIGFLGIGGGVFQVPILLFLLRYPPHITTATSHFITFLACGFGLLPHLFLGNIQFGEAVWMGLGVVIGAQIGAKLAPRLKSRTIVYLFVLVLFVFAMKLLI